MSTWHLTLPDLSNFVLEITPEPGEDMFASANFVRLNFFLRLSMLVLSPEANFKVAELSSRDHFGLKNPLSAIFVEQLNLYQTFFEKLTCVFRQCGHKRAGVQLELPMLEPLRHSDLRAQNLLAC